MNNIKYILVNDGAAEPRFNGPLAQFKVQGSKFKGQGGFAAVQRASPSSKIKGQRPSSKIKVQSGFAAGQSGSEREGLIDELCRLRKQYPKAKILGVSELGEHCVQPSERMNQLRRELSERL